MIKKIILYSFILLFGFISYIAFSIVNYGNKSVVTSSDAAIVLGAAIIGDQPSPVFQERINHGVFLYKSGVVNKIIFTGGIGKGQLVSESEVAQNYAIQHGVKPSDILIEIKSKVTYENFIEAKKILKLNGLKNVLIVSDSLHMKRAMAMASELGLKASPSPTPTSLYKTWKTKSGFLVREVYFYIAFILRRSYF